MRLALINQFYPPDIAPTGHVAASLAEHRAKLGDEVTVITSRGGYVSQPVSPGNRSGENPCVIRTLSPSLGKGTLLKRLVDYVAFYLLATLRTLSLPAQDVIISLTTPPFIAWAGAAHKLLHKETKLVLWSMDCYPEVLERAGLIRTNGLLSRWMGWLNRSLFGHVDHLVCLDNAMAALLSSRYIPAHASVPKDVVPNWERAKDFPPGLKPASWTGAGEIGLEGRFVVLYLGNAGYGHRFETVIEAARQVDREGVSFVFVGGGSMWPWLEDVTRTGGLANIHLRGYVPKVATTSVMSAAHCGLITLRESYAGVISPSKLHGYLAMSLPVIYIGPEGSNVDEAIQRYQCGVSLRHGDVNGMVEFIRRLQAQPERLKTYGSQARRAFEEAYSDDVCLPQFDRVLEQVARSTPT